MNSEQVIMILERAIARVEQLEAALRKIMRATIEGRVCDDVAWFDSITTLHDFCEDALGQSSPSARQENDDVFKGFRGNNEA